MTELADGLIRNFIRFAKLRCIKEEVDYCSFLVVSEISKLIPS